MTEQEIRELPYLLTVKETAKVLRIGINAAYELVWQKKIPVLQLGERKIRIPKQELLAWIDGHKGAYQN
jgi:excisionase family DNA binding protein